MRQPGGKLKLTMGISDFERVAGGDYLYVDKTLLIRDCIDSGAQVTLFTRPRRFGKTMNMRMLKSFYEIPPVGKDTAALFRDKKIWSCGSEYTSEQGKYPVIFLTFKDVKQARWEDALRFIGEVVQEEFDRHLYLADSQAVSALDRRRFAGVLGENPDEVRVSNALALLSRMLHAHHGRPAVIIVDEYDTPIQQAHVLGYYDDCIRFMRALLSGGFKDNEHLHKGFLTGILRVAKEGIFSGFNNPKVCTVLDAPFSEHFGFTPDEVRAMLVASGRGESFDEVSAWYDGYRFGDSEIFNPWSVIGYIDNGYATGTYWTNTGSNDVVGSALSHATPDVAEGLARILGGGEVETPIDTDVIYPMLHDWPDYVFGLLVMTGYLKVSSRRKDERERWQYKVTLPNREVGLIFENEVTRRFSQAVGPNVTASFAKALRSGDPVGLRDALTEVLKNSASFYDRVGEAFYQGLLLGLSLCASGEYIVTSNREGGMGRYDIQLEPFQANAGRLPGIIVELKSAQGDAAGEGGLARLASDALSQIASKDYARGLRARGIGTVLAFGCAFHGANVEVAFDTL